MKISEICFQPNYQYFFLDFQLHFSVHGTSTHVARALEATHLLVVEAALQMGCHHMNTKVFYSNNSNNKQIKNTRNK
jgi:hypothetical protein